MLDPLKLCLSFQFKGARKVVEKMSLSNKFRIWKRRKAKKLASGVTASSFAAMEVSSQFRQVFEFIDTNRDGKLSPSELKRVLLSLGDEKAMAAKEAEGILRVMDCDGDGFVDLDEFLSFMKIDRTQDSVRWQSDVVEAFRVFDADNDGLISAEELQRVLERLGSGKCSLKECRKMIKGVDRDGDGFVNVEEFKHMMSAGC